MLGGWTSGRPLPSDRTSTRVNLPSVPRPRLRCCDTMQMSIINAPTRGDTMNHTARLAFIDCFRGFAVLAMVLASYPFGTEVLPAWMRHTPDGPPVSSTSATAQSVSGSRFLLGGMP
jgi:hypothetical protein